MLNLTPPQPRFLSGEYFLETQEKTGKMKDRENALGPTGLHFTEFSKQKRKNEIAEPNSQGRKI